MYCVVVFGQPAAAPSAYHAYYAMDVAVAIISAGV
jgi:hypothetical protein